MIDKNIRTDVKKIVNQKRALFQNNNIKQRKLKQEIIKDNHTWKTIEEVPNTIRSDKAEFFNFKKDRNSFTPTKITSKQFEKEINEEIEFVKLFNNKITNQSQNLNFPKRPHKLNPLKINKNQKQVIKIDDFLILESDLSNRLNNNEFNRQQLKDFNKKLFQELKKLNYFQEENPKVEVASINKKMINKKTYKTYHKVLQDKFSTNFCTNIILKQNKSAYNNNKNEEVYKTTNSTLTYNNDSNSIISEKKNKIGTYLTTFDALDSNLNNIDFSDNVNFTINKNIQTKLERINKKISVEINQSHLSMEHTIRNNSNINNKSRASSNNSKLNHDRNSNYLETRTFSNKKSDKNILDNYIRLPKILISKMSLNNNTNDNNKSYNINPHIIDSKDFLKNFNKTKKQRYTLDALVSKISHKIGNGFPLKKYITDYNNLSNVYPKKELKDNSFTNHLISESPIKNNKFNGIKFLK